IPLAEKTTAADQELFGKWVVQLPKPFLGEPGRPIKALRLDQVGDRQYQADVHWPAGEKLQDVQWFPLPPKALGVEDAQTKSQGNESVFSFTLVPKPKDSVKMQFLVTYTDSNGKRQGVEFS